MVVQLVDHMYEEARQSCVSERWVRSQKAYWDMDHIRPAQLNEESYAVLAER